MRSVTVERKSRAKPRTQPVRPASKGRRELPAVQPGGPRRGAGPDVMGRIAARLALLARRPITLLCGVLVVLVLLAALFAGGGISRGAHAVEHGVGAAAANAGFGISEIHITGNRRTPYRQVLEVLGMKPGQSIFSADLWGAQNRLARLEWIAGAEIHRRYPDAIYVTLVEKRPFALWQPPPDAHGQAPILVVERNGRPITSHEVETFRHLPKLVGAGAPAAAADLVDAVGTRRAIAARIAAYARVSQRRWNLILDDGVVVQLPEIDWTKQLDVLDHLIIDSSILEHDITQIDLRSPTHYFFLLKNGDKKDVERGKET